MSPQVISIAYLAAGCSLSVCFALGCIFWFHVLRDFS